jgi:NADPH-dependent glutamate synthase beta subunit-like oxidoreductase
MMYMVDQKYFVAVVGAGPAGLYAARKLAQDGAQVVLFNRDIKPGGLALLHKVSYEKRAAQAVFQDH